MNEQKEANIREVMQKMTELAHDYLESNAQDIDLAISEARIDFPEICKQGEYSEEQFEFLEELITDFGSLLVACVTNDSMSPFIDIDDVLFINKRASISEGDIVCVDLQDTALVRRIYYIGEQIELRADNDAYQPIFADPEEVKILGKVEQIQKKI